MRACASEAVRSPISWPWAWRFRRPGLLGLGFGEPVGVTEGVGDGLAGFAAGLELADGKAAGEAAVSASTEAGAKKASPPARLRTAIVTLRRVQRRIATEGGAFTTL